MKINTFVNCVFCSLAQPHTFSPEVLHFCTGQNTCGGVPGGHSAKADIKGPQHVHLHVLAQKWQIHLRMAFSHGGHLVLHLRGWSFNDPSLTNSEQPLFSILFLHRIKINEKTSWSFSWVILQLMSEHKAYFSVWSSVHCNTKGSLHLSFTPAALKATESKLLTLWNYYI